MVVLSSESSCVPRWRFNTTLLKQEEFRTQFGEKFKTFLEINAGSADDPRILWDSKVLSGVMLYYLPAISVKHGC